MPETCRVLWQNTLWIFYVSGWLFYTKLITMHGHLNIKHSLFTLMGMKLSSFIISDETTSKTADWQQMCFQLQAFWSPDEFRAWLWEAYFKFHISESPACCNERRVLSVIQAPVNCTVLSVFGQWSRLVTQNGVFPNNFTRLTAFDSPLF